MTAPSTFASARYCVAARCSSLVQNAAQSVQTELYWRYKKGGAGGASTNRSRASRSKSVACRR
eukprot:1597752-Rhodomonas_salina.1